MEDRMILYSVEFSENAEAEKSYMDFCKAFDTHDYSKGDPDYSREFEGVYEEDPFNGTHLFVRETGEFVKEGSQEGKPSLGRFIIDGISLEVDPGTTFGSLKRIPSDFILNMNSLNLISLNKMFKAL